MRILLACLTLLLCWSGKPESGRLSEWMDLHRKAVNAEALEAMKSVRKMGIMTFGTNQVPFTSYQKGINFRLEQRFGNMDMVSILNKDGAWKENPWNKGKVEVLGGGELRKLKEMAMSGGLLINGEAFGYKLRLAKEDSLGKDHPVVQVDCGDGSYYKVHLNPETYLVDKRIFYQKAEGRNTKVETVVKKYMTQGGVQFPSMLDETFQGEPMASYSVVAIDTRLDLDLNLFKKPNGGE